MRALFAIIFGSLLTTCSNPPSLLEQIISQGQLRIVTRNAPTTFYYGPDGPRGIEYELAMGFADYLGVDSRFQIADEFRRVLPAVSEGKAHIGAAGLTVTSTRSQIVDFGPTYQTSQQQVLYRRGQKRPRDLDDLLGGRIEVLADSSYVRTLQSAKRDFPSLTWSENETADVEELVERVAAGEIDYTIIDSNIFALLRQYHPEARAAFSIGRTDSIAWALPKGAQALREAVAAYFAEIRATGKLHSLIERYNFAARNYDYVGSRAFVRHVEARLPQYREYFEEAAASTSLDWRLVAAIAYQESHWNPDAVSPTGVRGIMMLTERTARVVDVADRHDAQQSILGGSRYLVRMLERIPARIDEPDRLWMALAAYNIGYGHLEDARVITEINGADPDSWEDVRNHLPLLSEERWYSRVRRGYARGDVPVQYVDNVRRYYELLHWAVSDDRPSDEAEEQLVSPDATTASTEAPLTAFP